MCKRGRNLGAAGSCDGAAVRDEFGVRAAFASVHADEALVAATKARVRAAARAEAAREGAPHAEAAQTVVPRRGEARQTPGARQGSAAHPFARRVLVPAFACVLALCALVGCKAYFTESALIAVQINPALELSVNRFDRVIAVAGTNADGERLAAALDVRFLPYDEALACVLAEPQVARLMDEGRELSVTVLADDEALRERVYAGVCRCTGGQPGVTCERRARAGWGVDGEGGGAGYGNGYGNGGGNGGGRGGGAGAGTGDGTGNGAGYGNGSNRPGGGSRTQQ